MNTKGPGSLCLARLLRGAIVALAIVLVLAATMSQSAQAQTYSALHNFTGHQDGSDPMTGLAIDRAGNLYGTTPFGGYTGGNCAGQGGCGVVFKLTNHEGSWILMPLYLFTGGSDGMDPFAGVTIGPDGNLYGTTVAGGNGCQPSGCGTVFKLSPPARPCHSIACTWTETVLYRFSDSSTGLSSAFGGVTFDLAGNLYGTTATGGTGNCNDTTCGAVYRLAPSGGSWTPSVIYSFLGGSDGTVPTSTLAIDHAGNLYGTTIFGGIGDSGTVFQLIRSGAGWSENVLYRFQGGNDGANPFAGPIQDSAGNLYGDTTAGGAQLGGVAFELVRSGGIWAYAVLSSFTGGLDGSLSLDSSGNLYGTTYGGGRYGSGSIFKLSLSGDVWTETDLYDFPAHGGTGAFPYSNVTLDASGNLYGTATSGGTAGQGVAWEITP